MNLPYIFRHAANAQLGLEYKWLEANLSVRYNSDMRTAPGQGTYRQRTSYPQPYDHRRITQGTPPNRHLTLSLNAVNLANKVYLVSRHPSGLRPGHPSASMAEYVSTSNAS